MHHPPIHLCNSDGLGFKSVHGHAFAFFDADAIVQWLSGVTNNFLGYLLFDKTNVAMKQRTASLSVPLENIPIFFLMYHSCLFFKFFSCRVNKLNWQVDCIELFHVNALD